MLKTPLVVAAVGRLEMDPPVGALVVTGGGGAFCARVDLPELCASRQSREDG